MTLIPLLVLGRDGCKIVSSAEVQRCLPGVGSQEVEAARVPFLELCGQGIITGPAAVVSDQHARSELRKGNALCNRNGARRIQPTGIQVAALRQLISLAAG